MADSYMNVLAATVFLVLVSKLFQTHAAANNNIITTGFSVDLIHRDSPLSPLYNPSETNSDRLRNAFRRSMARVNHRFMTKAKKTTVQPQADQATLIDIMGEYFMIIYIGTPPVIIPGFADTGRDLTWTQCLPCINCFKQVSPLFDPKKSSTYNDYPCESLPCKAVGKLNYCNPQNLCEYSYSYADGSSSNGLLATETITIGTVSLPDMFFGCGHNNSGLLLYQQFSGFIGLGRGPLSLINQFSPSIGHKFSYCLVPRTSLDTPSKIYFGSEGVVSGDGVVSTPFVTNGTDATHYYLALQAISVGKKMIMASNGMASNGQNGNIIIVMDYGTLYTSLPRKFYNYFVVAIENVIDGKQRVPDPYGNFDLCYQTDEPIVGPIVTFHFSGNADVDLETTNTFLQVSEHVFCFAVVPTDGVAVYGELLQRNFLIGYDLDSQTVSFKPANCLLP